MALEPLINPAHVDPSMCIMDRVEIARYLPHRGPIAMLDRLVYRSEDDNEGAAVCEIPQDPWWADGHIPGHPLMPGVLQIEAAAQLSSLLFYRRANSTTFAGFTRINDVTFRGMVSPGDQLILLCVGIKYSPKRFVTRVQGVVKSEIVFDGEISGMAFPHMGEIERTPLTESSQT